MAKESIYGFQSSDTANKLSAFAAQLGGSKSGSTLQNFSTSGVPLFYGKVSTAVTAASGSDLGTGKVKPQTWDVADTTPTIVEHPDAEEIDVWNTEEVGLSLNETCLVYKVRDSYIVFKIISDSGTGYGALSVALLGTDATASVAIDSTSPIGAGLSVTATNWVGMDGSVGQKCIVAKTAGEWILIQMACSAPSDDDGGSGGGDSGGSGGSGGDSGGGDSGGGGSPGGGTP